MPRTCTSPLLLLLLTLLTGLATSCGMFHEPLCGCAPPPQQPYTTAMLTRTDTWWLQEVVVADQITRGAAIKDRFSLRFHTDGTYSKILLADGTEYIGTYMLMGTDNRTLHLTDHKGDAQDYTLLGGGPENLTYSQLNKAGQREVYGFKNTQ
jgi:hypothetical protein